MLKTTNYGLKKPEGTDVVNIDDINYNTDILDTQLKKINDNLGDAVKKDGSVQRGLNADTVDGKHASDFAANSHSHDRLIGANSNTIRVDNVNDYAGLDKKNNIDISSWYGVSISNACPNTGVQGKPSVSIDARTGNISTSGSIWIPNGDIYVNGQSLFQSAANVKSKVADAINNKGGSANSGMSGEQLAASIGNMSAGKISTGTTQVTKSIRNTSRNEIYFYLDLTPCIDFTPDFVITTTTASGTAYCYDWRNEMGVSNTFYTVFDTYSNRIIYSFLDNDDDTIYCDYSNIANTLQYRNVNVPVDYSNIFVTQGMPRKTLSGNTTVRGFYYTSVVSNWIAVKRA
ncbi:hypothetical protein FHX91_004144 [Clostridium saccharobutylicum]|uniref:hypothetical protein n=1 Tax=Clostridium saccharobutylicum TaxID=169679 RepID=UPI0015713D33|nr:hypothetical protein [Clostridium saccharobutylicum]NSB50306.1 hypothetical protein [Clostridium saccharobutylicum]